ncbi:IS3 family transposase [Xenorhabdus bovienii]|uniref:Integrase catalytic domain-containing protein n=1 Tax=Xenorhabdus bovienii str. kraussei Becker Underwood TaxID=1398204 RepID=A0A077PXZ9_XENBV|nr:hypothetical protein XBKB1_4110001 [Xenorhabdus bovienii str. kraussei Becker Underwood]
MKIHEEMKKDVLDYLHYYNLTRLHMANDYLTSVEYTMALKKVSGFFLSRKLF